MLRCVSIVLALALMALAPAIARAAVEPETAASEQAKAEPEYGCSYKIEECLNWMAKHYGERGWAGMNLDVESFPYVVTETLPGSPAEGAGILPGDLLVAVNGVEIAEQNEAKLLKIREKMKPGVQFTYTIKRDGKRRNVECVLVEMPLDIAAEQIGRHLLVGHLPAHLAFDEQD